MVIEALEKLLAGVRVDYAKAVGAEKERLGEQGKSLRRALDIMKEYKAKVQDNRVFQEGPNTIQEGMEVFK